MPFFNSGGYIQYLKVCSNEVRVLLIFITSGLKCCTAQPAAPPSDK